MYNIVDTIFNKQKKQQQQQQQQQNKNIYNNENRETVRELISFYPGRNYR